MTLASESDPSRGFSCEQTADRADLCGPGLRLAFGRIGAVWTHSVFTCGAGGNEVEVARTVESDPARDQPGRVVSPVYQDIQRHQGAEGSGLCLLATGTLYQHHFSAVVALEDDPGRPGGLVVDVDVADRCRRAVESLAATYTVRLDSGALVAAGPEAIEWEIGGGSGFRLALEAVAPSTLVMAEAGRSATRVQILAALDAGGFTHRLHYRWRWASRSGLTR
jgi:hypothetical protein